MKTAGMVLVVDEYGGADLHTVEERFELGLVSDVHASVARVARSSVPITSKRKRVVNGLVVSPEIEGIRHRNLELLRPGAGLSVKHFEHSFVSVVLELGTGVAKTSVHAQYDFAVHDEPHFAVRLADTDDLGRLQALSRKADGLGLRGRNRENQAHHRTSENCRQFHLFLQGEYKTKITARVLYHKS